MPEFPSMIDRFHVKQRLKADASGQILVCWDVVNQVEVFLRVAPNNLLGTAALTDWFQREFDRTSRIQHPNLSRLLDSATTSVVGPYLVSERPVGVSLDRMVAAGLPLATSLHLLIHVSHALIVAGNAGVVPLELLPKQIRITPEGSVKVAIFDGHAAVDDLEDALCSAFAPRALELLSGRLLNEALIPENRASFLQAAERAELPHPLLELFQRAFAAERESRFPALRVMMDMLIAASPLSEDRQLELLELMASDQPLGEDPLVAAAVPPQGSWEELFPQAEPDPVPPAPLLAEGASSGERPRRTGWFVAAALVACVLGIGVFAALRGRAAIAVRVEPVGAEIRVDGKLLGRAPLGPTRDIKPGMVVQADSEGYLPHRYAVKEGDSQLDLKLERVPPPTAKEPDPPAPVAVTEPIKPPPAAEPKPVVKVKPKPPSAPQGKKGDVFDQIRKQM